MNKQQERHYKATVKRGKINSKSDAIDFVNKIFDETFEVQEAVILNDKKQILHELCDVISVCQNAIIHFGGDPEIELEKNTRYQETRRS